MGYLLEATLNLTAYKGSDIKGKVEIALSENVSKYYQLGEYNVPEAAVDQELDLSGLITTVSELWMVSNQTLTVKLGSNTGTAIQFKGAFCISGGSVTSLFFTNASGSDAIMELYSGG